MSRASLGGAVVLATAMGIVGAVTSFGASVLTIGTVLIVSTLGSLAIHAVVSPQSYGYPRFTSTFYRAWSIGVLLLAVAALVTSAFSGETAQQVAYWSGFASVALLAGAVVDHRTSRTTVSSR